MTRGENPFDDAEIAQELRKRGIVRKPGMAAELMEEIAPLLKAEGLISLTQTRILTLIR